MLLAVLRTPYGILVPSKKCPDRGGGGMCGQFGTFASLHGKFERGARGEPMISAMPRARHPPILHRSRKITSCICQTLSSSPPLSCTSLLVRRSISLRIHAYLRARAHTHTHTRWMHGPCVFSARGVLSLPPERDAADAVPTKIK